MAIGVRKEQIRSVILCHDREFKRKSITFLNGSAFPAEKFQVENFGEVVDLVGREPMLHNFVIDGSDRREDELIEILKVSNEKLGDQIKILLYLGEHQEALKDTFAPLHPRLCIAVAEIGKADFNRAFHQRNDARAKWIKDLNKKKTPALSLIETSKHLKDTIDLLNRISKQRDDLASIDHIGQRFNGLIGAFSFFGSKDGYPELRKLAMVIDDVCRTYEDGSKPSISEEHFNLLMDSARCSYLILKDMRETDSIAAERVSQCEQVLKVFQARDDIRKREITSQDEIDAMLENLDKSS